MGKKIIVCVVLAVTLVTALLAACAAPPAASSLSPAPVSPSSGDAAAASTAEAFLTALYTGDAARFASMQEKMSLPPPSDATPDRMADYKALYAPLMTEKGLETFFAGGYAVDIDRYAAENQAVFVVSKVTLIPDTGTQALAQYRYRAELTVTTPAGETAWAPEGTITLDTTGETPLVNSFKPYDKPILAGLPDSQPQANPDDFTQDIVRTLIPTGNAYSYSWASPEEITPDDLVNICAYNNLLNLPLEKADTPIAKGGGYADPFALADGPQVEAALQKLFDVSAEHLRTSSLYNADRQGYQMLCGWGGGWRYLAMESQEAAGKTHITVGQAFDLNPPKEVGTLVVEIAPDQSVRYLSYTLK